MAFFGVLLLGVLALGFAYAGSADVVADGVTVSGQDVGGLSAAEAETKLSTRAQALSSEPVVFTEPAAAGRSHPRSSPSAETGAARRPKRWTAVTARSRFVG